MGFMGISGIFGLSSNGAGLLDEDDEDEAEGRAADVDEEDEDAIEGRILDADEDDIEGRILDEDPILNLLDILG